jgi:hypothetical protein
MENQLPPPLSSHRVARDQAARGAERGRMSVLRPPWQPTEIRIWPEDKDPQPRTGALLVRRWQGSSRGKMVAMTTGGPVAGQLGLFGDAVPDAVPEPVLMALHGEYYDLIWQGLKTHEFRRRFLEGRATRWFVYLNAPVSRLAAVIDLGPAVAGSPEEVAAIAERMRPGKRWDRNTSERGHGVSEFLAGPGPAGVRSLVRDQ